MSAKLRFLVGLGVGYVLGARSGREQYDELSARARQWWSDPRVQEKAGRAQQLVKEKSGQAQRSVTSTVKGAVKAKVSSASSSASKSTFPHDPDAPSAGAAGSAGPRAGVSSDPSATPSGATP